MAYELTVGGYTFDNPPERYNKSIRLGNTEQPHFQRFASSFYQSDTQELTFEVEGSLSLNETADLSELQRLQELAIDGGEVFVDFDPFFSGRCIIQDDPFTQSNQEGTYSFTFAVNRDQTNAGAYPPHDTPQTGSTFTLGNFNFGYDPNSVEQDYARQTASTERLKGVTKTVDTKGLVTHVELTGYIDGDGQALLWQNARNNVLAYLNAEFQNGWTLIRRLSVRNEPDAPDYLTGLFRYRISFYVVKNPADGIGEVSHYIDHDVKDTGTYVSDDDAGAATPEGLTVTIAGGTGSLDDAYVTWDETDVTLSPNTTNYVFVTDSDGDTQGTVQVNQSAFPGSSVRLWTFVTDADSVVDSTDQRAVLIGDDDTTGSDLVFSEDLTLDDTELELFRVLAFADTFVPDDTAISYRGLVQLAEAMADPTGQVAFSGNAPLTDTATVVDGGSASASGAAEALTWSGASDWDTADAESRVVHEATGDYAADSVQQGYPAAPFGTDTMFHIPFHEDSGTTFADVSGNNRNGNAVNQVTAGATGVLNANAAQFQGTNDYVTIGDYDPSGSYSIVVVINPDTVSDDGARLMVKDPGGSYGWALSIGDNGNPGMVRFFQRRPTGDTTDTPQNTVVTGQWQVCIGVWDDPANTRQVWVDGVKEAETTGHSGSVSSSNSDPVSLGGYNDSPDHFTGRMAHAMLINKALSPTEVQDLTDTLLSGSLTTGPKSFSGDAPAGNLQIENVGATLNGQTLQVTVQSDPDGDGTYEETSDPITVDGTGGPYPVNGLSTPTQTVRAVCDFSTANPERAAILSGLDISYSSTDSDQNPNTDWAILGAKYDSSGNEYEGGGVTSLYGG